MDKFTKRLTLGSLIALAVVVLTFVMIWLWATLTLGPKRA